MAHRARHDAVSHQSYETPLQLQSVARHRQVLQTFLAGREVQHANLIVNINFWIENYLKINDQVD
jgi:hypothetical protein